MYELIIFGIAIAAALVPFMNKNATTSSHDKKVQNYEKRTKYSSLYRQRKPLIGILPTSFAEKENLRIRLTEELNEMAVSKSSYASRFGFSVDGEGYAHTPPAGYAQVLAEFDDAVALLAQEVKRVIDAQNSLNTGRNNTSNEQTKDNSRRSQSQPQPHWNKPPGQSGSYNSQPPTNSSNAQNNDQSLIKTKKTGSKFTAEDKENFILGFVHCGYSREEAERIVKFYGADSYSRLYSEGIKVIQERHDLPEGEVRKLIGKSGLFEVLKESQKQLPPASNT